MIAPVNAMASVRRPTERVATRAGLLALACACVLASQPGTAQTGDADTRFVYFRGDDWSLEVRWLRETYQRWQARRIAAERLVKFPESANTVAWLVQANRLSDALDVLERIIARQPTR